MKKSRRRWHMIAWHIDQSVACASSRKFRETDASRSSKKVFPTDMPW
jgi:hypothetical protein